MAKTDPEKLKRLRELTITKERDIRAYMHCALCMDDFKAKTNSTLGESPESYARLSVGFTPIGLQVWCVRHDCNVCHIDFEGHQHPANTARKRT